MIEGILIGLTTALTPTNLLMVMVGCFAGTFIGMLPGLGPISAIALMIPITYGFDPATGMILMAGVYYGAIFGGSTSSILINAPGVAGTVATSFDGYPMARAGHGGKALAVAAYASFSGGTIAAILAIAVIMVLALRSVGLGLLSLVPNGLPILATFGAWALLVGEVGFSVATVASISLGIVVDDTVHFLSKYTRARRERGTRDPVGSQAREYGARKLRG